MKRFFSRALAALLAALLIACALPVAAASYDGSIAVGVPVTGVSNGTDAVYNFDPPQAGAYSLKITTDMFLNIYISDVSGEEIYSEEKYSENGRLYQFYLTDECSIRLEFYSEGEEYTLTVNDLPLSDSLDTYIGIHHDNTDTYTACVGANESVYTYTDENEQVYIGYMEFSSSNPEVAYVDYPVDSSTPTLFPKSVGETDITVSTVYGLQYTFHLKVVEPQTINLAERQKLLFESENGYYDFFYTFVPEDSDEYVFVTDKDPNISGYISGQVVDADGGYVTQFYDASNAVAGLNAGKTYYISVRCEIYSLWGVEEPAITFFVDKPVDAEGVNITDGMGGQLSQLELYVGNTVTLGTTFYPLNARPEELIWSCDNPDVVQITEQWSSSALITAVGEGRATVTVISQDGRISNSLVVEAKGRAALNKGDNIIEYTDGQGAKEFEMNFVPDESGYYSLSAKDFSSYGNITVNYWIYDQDKNEMAFTWSSPGSEASVSCNLTAGEQYTVRFSVYADSYGNFNFSINENLGIVSLELASPPDKTEYVEGEVLFPDMRGLSLKAQLSDGSEVYWNYSEDSSDNQIAGYNIFISVLNDENGNFTDIEIRCAGFDILVPLTVTESPVAAIEFADGALEIPENTGGYNNGDFFYYYSSSLLCGSILRIIYNDGTVKPFEFSDNSEDIELDGYNFNFTDNQYELGGWTVDTENYITVSYLGASTQIPVKIVSVSDKIEKFELAGGSISVTENVDGYEENGAYIYYPDYSSLVFKVTYTDGTVKQLGIYDDIDGMYINCDSYADQLEKPWVLGGENFATFSFWGVSCSVPVTVKPNTVKEIKLIPPEKTNYVFGDTSYGTSVIESDGKVKYYLIPKMEDGYKLQVTYTDGSVKTYTAADIDQYGNLNGEIFRMLQTFADAPGKIRVRANYMGFTAETEVEITPSPVKSVEVIKLPEISKYEFITNVYIGMELRINYTDGRSETVTVTDDIIDRFDYGTDDSYDVRPFINGYPLETSMLYNEDETNQIYVIYRGAAAKIGDYNPDYTDLDIADIKFVSLKKDIIGSVVRFTFVDGSYLDVKLNADFESSGIFFTKTPYGYLNFTINPDNSIWVQGCRENIYVNFVPGDLNGDMSVDIKDLVRLKKHLGNGAVIESSADFDCDGDTDAVDLAQMRRALMGEAPISTVKGDIDCNGFVSRVDLELLKLWLEGQDMALPLTADVNGDGKITADDAELLESMIQQKNYNL